MNVSVRVSANPRITRARFKRMLRGTTTLFPFPSKIRNDIRKSDYRRKQENRCKRFKRCTKGWARENRERKRARFKREREPYEERKIPFRDPDLGSHVDDTFSKSSKRRSKKGRSLFSIFSLFSDIRVSYF